MVAAQYIRIEIRVARPHDRAEVWVDLDCLERLSVITYTYKHAASREHSREIDLVYRAIRKGQAHPVTTEWLDAGDSSACARHGSGGTGSGASVWANSEFERTRCRAKMETVGIEPTSAIA